MKSTQKVAAAIDHVESIAGDPGADTLLQGAAMMLAMGRGYVDQLVPRDPRDLDDLLTKGAEWMLSLRSDDVAELEAPASAARD